MDLVAEQLITARQWDKAVLRAGQTGQDPVQVLLAQGSISEEELTEMRGRHLGVPFVEPNAQAGLGDLIPAHLAQRYQVFPVRQAAIEDGMRTLQDDAVEKILLGQTTVEEALRVVSMEGSDA
jgi:type II secretory ATPase GspE/PulE/Tfp pilus assembly ATPase PilB-like protein